MASAAPKTPFDVRTRVNFGALTDPGRVMGYRAFRVLVFVWNYREKEGQEPTYPQICDALGIGTTGEVSQIMRSLECRGFVRRPGGSGPTKDRRVRLMANP